MYIFILKFLFTSMMKNAFYFILKALFCSWYIYIFVLLFGYVEKRLEKKAMVNFKTHDVKDWTTNNCNTHIAQYLQKKTQPCNEIWSLNLKYHTQNMVDRLVPEPFYKNSKLSISLDQHSEML